MPAKTPNPASLVKLTPQTPSTEKNKPRKQVKEKNTTASISQPGINDDSVENKTGSGSKRLPAIYITEKRFDVLVDGVPYIIHTIPFLWNENICFRVHINGNEAHVFSWDEGAGSLRAIDDASSILPDGVEQAIQEKIIS